MTARGVRTMLGRPELSATGAVLFLVLVTWPLWASARPSTTFLAMFAAWLAFTGFSLAVTFLGRDPGPDAVDDVDDEDHVS